MPIHASDEINTSEPQDTPSSTGDTYEYADIDEFGNVTILHLPEVDTESIEQERLEQAESFDLVLHIGNQESVIDTYETYEEAQSAKKARDRARSVGSVSVQARVSYANINHGMVNFHTKASSQTTSYTYLATGTNGYTNGAYAKDGAFLGYCDANETQVKFKQAGVIGCVNASEVSVIDVDKNNVSVSFYKVINGTLTHTIRAGDGYSSALGVGPMQSYMKEGAIYYSYDGHYFYLDYNTMLDDYKANVVTHAINPNQPYYSYFQYLSHRTQTNYTAAQLDSFINAKTASNSKLRGMGKYFVEYQNTYGANAVLMLATAINESYWGVSSIATEKNNLFGHNAVDSSPGLSADAYATPQASIEDHAKNYISRDYMDPKDAGKKYYGNSLGDKATGVNVKYASDPYWGEKAATYSYAIDNYLGKKDLGDYELGIKNVDASVRVRSDASEKSNLLYETGSSLTYPVVILGEKSGSSVGGNSIWYKIQSDPTLNADRSAMTQDVCVYDFANAYGYISAYYVTPVKYTNINSGSRPSESTNIITSAGLKNSGGYVSGIDPGTSVSTLVQKLKAADGNASVTVKNKDGAVTTNGNIGTGMTFTVVQNGVTSNYNIVVYGDVNGDGSIGATDLYCLKMHIVGKQKLTGAYLVAGAIANNSAGATSLYKIKNHIIGKESIIQ